MLLGFVNRIVW